MDEIALGQWVAYRNDSELLFNEKIAIFATREEAQRAADAHFRDGAKALSINVPNTLIGRADEVIE